jgi:predicted MFS family arabinose efflux permease
MSKQTKGSAVLPHADSGVSAWMIVLLAGACGLIVANLYYAQPLIGLIAPAIALDPSAASLIVTLTQAGYCVGLILLVPLGDLAENRRLVLTTLSGVVVALIVAAVAQSAPWFLAASLFIGLGSVTVQMLLPIAAHLTAEASRGRVIGNVMGGLLTGIMLARPVSSLIASAYGWRSVFGASAVLMALLGLILWRSLPQRRPVVDHGYVELIGSLWALLRDTPLLRRRAAYQAALFAAFSLYWTAVPLLLSGPIFGLTQRGIALFALAGVAGALSAPIAGRLADRGWTRVATGAALVLGAMSFLLARAGGAGSLPALLGAGILLDFSAQANVVLGQRAIYALGAHIRSRLNGLYIAIFFAGGALGSSIASLAYSHGGWSLVSWIGFAFPVAGLLFYATERSRD